jgi:hypothetical protein
MGRIGGEWAQGGEGSMGIREALSRRRARRTEKRALQASTDAKVGEIAEYVNATSIVYAMGVQGFVPEMPPGVDPGKLDPEVVVDRCLELAEGDAALVGQALVRARTLDNAPKGDPQRWNRAEYDQMRFHAGVMTALHRRKA